MSQGKIWRFAFTKGQSHRKPSSLLRKNQLCFKNKIICNRAIHTFTCLHSGPVTSPAETSLSSSGTSSSLPASEAFCNVSSLCDPTVQHLCSPTAPVIIICSLETKTEKGMGNVDDTSCLQASWGAELPAAATAVTCVALENEQFQRLLTGREETCA